MRTYTDNIRCAAAASLLDCSSDAGPPIHRRTICFDGPGERLSIALCPPLPTEVPPDWWPYVSILPDGDLWDLFDEQALDLYLRIVELSPDMADYSYAPGKWTVRQVLGHLLDTERIVAYRALALARGETAQLPGYDEHDYVTAGPYGQVDLSAIGGEYLAVRQSSVSLFRTMTASAWLRQGLVNGEIVSVRALAYVLAGHERHHMRVLREKYGLPLNV